ncbi:MAG: RNA helicase domain-containing protein, partial [Candidatus Bathyarchaeota archaeon]|nr:RNA helicase domain-containing protein [Candidatus Bathyarchaeota archaeon]
AAMLSGTHSRVEPLCVMFTGPPGVGKTTAIRFLQEGISYCDQQVFTEAQVYSFNSSNEFWERYAHQKYVVLDDIFKSNDQKICGTEAQAVIDMINTSVYSLPMAFESKGCVFFDSEYVIMSTNIANNGIESATLNSVGIRDPGAILRRLHVVLHRVEKLDPENPIAKDQISFRVDKCRRKVNGESLVGKTYTAGELVVILRQLKAQLVKEKEDMSCSPEYLRLLFPNVRVESGIRGVNPSLSEARRKHAELMETFGYTPRVVASDDSSPANPVDEHDDSEEDDSVDTIEFLPPTTRGVYPKVSYCDQQVFTEAQVYSFNSSNEFWERYAHQKYVVLDDIFKSNDQKICGTEAQAVIDMINTSVYSLPMAFESKGCVFFDSEYVIMSTNIANNGIESATLNSVGIRDPGAILRRLHVVLHRVEKLDPENPIAKDQISFRVDKCRLTRFNNFIVGTVS